MFNKKLLGGTLVALAFANPLAADPIGPTDSLFVGQGALMIDDDPQFFDVGIDQQGNLYLPSDLNYANNSGDSISMSLSGNVDPVQNLAVGVVDLGAPSNFAIAISVPLIPPIPGLASFTTTISGSCTDGGTDGCGATPFMGPMIGQFLVNGFATVVDNLGPGFAVPTPGNIYGPFNNMGIFDCAPLGGCTSFETLLRFTGSGGGDSFSFTSRFELNPVTAVAEPGSALLLSLGLLQLFRLRRSRSRTS